jgi:hypothetical protein
MDKLPFPSSLRMKLLLNHLERNWEHRLEKLMGSRPQHIAWFPSIQLLGPFTPVPDRTIQVADYERIDRRDAVFSQSILPPT